MKVKDKDNEIIGVILLNLGGPDSLQAVKPFLYNLFSDRQIIKLGPSLLQKPIAWLISSLRSKNTENMYSLIGGRSPILDITSAQAKALEEALNKEGARVRGQGSGSALDDREPLPLAPCLLPHASCPMPLAFKVYIGMRYWHPLIEDVIPEIFNAGIKRLIALSLYPQYSVTTSGSSLTKLKHVVESYPIETFCIPSWFDYPLYIEALVDIIKKGLESFSQESEDRSQKIEDRRQKSEVRSQESEDTDNPHTHHLEKGGTGGVEKMGTSNIPNSEPHIHVLFSAHSLPQKIIDEGDPYVDQINGTIREITKIIPIKWHLSFQSKSGPIKWLEPSTDEKLKELATEGIKNILLVPISFVSDHIETLYEIDILYKNLAEKLGITLKRVDSLNTHPIFIEALKNMVIKSAKEKGWT